MLSIHIAMIIDIIIYDHYIIFSFVYTIFFLQNVSTLPSLPIFCIVKFHVCVWTDLSRNTF